jgi:hypothetical protein
MTGNGGNALGRFKNLLGAGKSGAVRGGSALSSQEQHQAILLLRDYEESGIGW